MSDVANINHTTEDEQLTYCTVHPNRETGLRCNKCDRLMCSECAVQTPVGYRCSECTRQHDDRFFNIESSDYIKVAGVSFGLAVAASFVIHLIGWLFVALVAGLPIGGAIAGMALRVIERRRGRETMYYATGAAVVGGFVGSILGAYFNYPQIYRQTNAAASQLQINADVPTITEWMLETGLTDITVLIFIGLMTAAIYVRLKV